MTNSAANTEGVSEMGYRVDVTIRGEQSATLNYASDADPISVIAAVAMAFDNSVIDSAEYGITVTEIKITLNGE